MLILPACPVGAAAGSLFMVWVRLIGRGWRVQGAVLWLKASLPASASMVVMQLGSKRGDVYNILWGLVFGFATLNILSLVTRRFEPNRNRMSFGELMAVMTVVVSVLLLTFEMLGLFNILPLRLHVH
jgi:hypothetical protein